MRYQIDLNQTNQYGTSNKQSMLSMIKSTSIEAEFICHENTSDFEIRLNLSPSISKIDSLNVEIVCEHPEDQIKMNRVTHGDFSSKGNGKAEWILRQLKPNVFSPVFMDQSYLIQRIPAMKRKKKRKKEQETRTTKLNTIKSENF